MAGFSTAEDVGKRNRTAGDEQGTAPDGTTYRRSGPQRPQPFMASERVDARQLQVLNLTLPSALSRRPGMPRGSAKLTGVAG